jgi:hypothetical protein
VEGWQRCSSRKTCGSLYTGEKGGDEDGVKGVVGKAAELWSRRFGVSCSVSIHDMCLSRTTMVLRVACCVFEVEERKMCVAFNAKILSERLWVLAGAF